MLKRFTLIIIQISFTFCIYSQSYDHYIETKDLLGLKKSFSEHYDFSTETLGQLLNKASLSGNLEIVKFLVDGGADLRKYGDEAMHSALNNDPEIIRYFVSKGVDINNKDNAGETVLLKIVMDMDQAMKDSAEFFSDTANNYSKLSLYWYNTTKMFLELGADINISESRNYNDSVPLLFHALYIEYLELFDKYHPDYSMLSSKGETALYISLIHDKVDEAKFIFKRNPTAYLQFFPYLFLTKPEINNVYDFLIGNGISENIQNEDGQTFLMYSINNHNIKTAECLLKKKVDPNIKDKNGLTAIFYAISSGANDILGLMLSAGANIDAKDDNGNTPLIDAVSRCNYKAAEWLIKNGAIVNVENNIGDTPFKIAKRRDYSDFIKLLRENGAEETLGKSVPVLFYPVSEIKPLVISDDGEYLLVNADGRSALLDVKTNKILRYFESGNDDATFSSDSKYIIDYNTREYTNQGREFIICLFEAYSGQVIRKYVYGSNFLGSTLSHNNKFLLFWDDKNVYVRDFETDKTLLEILNVGTRKVIFSKDDNKIFFAQNDSLKIFDIYAKKQIGCYYLKNKSVIDICLSPDGQKLLVSGADSTVKVINVLTGKTQFFKKERSLIAKMAFKENGTKVVYQQLRSDSTVICDISGKSANRIYYTGKVLNYSFNGRYALLHDSLINIDNGKAVIKFIDKRSDQMSFDISEDSRYLFFNKVKWDLKENKISKSPEVSLSPNDKFLYMPDKSHFGVRKTSDLSPVFLADTFKNYDYTYITDFFFANTDTVFYGIAGDELQSIFEWSLAQNKIIKKFQSHKSAIKCTSISSDGSYIFSFGEDSLGIIWSTVTGKVVLKFTSIDNITAACFSNDNKWLFTGGYNMVKKRNISNGEIVSSFKNEWGGDIRKIKISNNNKCLDIVFDYGSLLLDTNGLWKFTGDGKFILNGNKIAVAWGDIIYVLNTDDFQLAKTIKTNSKIRDFNFTDNEKKLWVKHDHSIDLYDFTNDKLSCSIMVFDSVNYSIVTPSGLFDATPDAMKLMYFVQGNEIIELYQLKERYYEPGLLQKILGYNTEPLRDVKGFNDVKMYPSIDLADKGNGILNIDLHNQGGGIGKVIVFINGKEVVSDARGPSPNPNADSLKLELKIKDNPFLVSDGDNLIEVKAYNAEGYLLSRGIQINYKTNKKEASLIIPKLFIVAIGTSDYNGNSIDLKYAAKDAEDMANALEIGGTRLFGKERTFTYKLTTNNTDEKQRPKRSSIFAAFEDIAKKANSNDIVVVYISGHGISWGGQDGDFYYLTEEAFSANADAYNDPAIRASSSISSKELNDVILKIPALKQVLIIDACASGKMVDNLLAKRDISSSTIRAFDKMKDRTGMHIITGCAADAVSYEATKFGQGLLTYSILEGIKGSALLEGKYLDVVKLFQNAQERVPIIAAGIGGIQKPEAFSRTGSGSFYIGMMNDDDKMKIKLPIEKPMFLLSSFQDEKKPRDVLGFGKLVDEALRNNAAQNNLANIVFIEATDYPEAYTISGRYSLQNDEVVLNVIIYKGNEEAFSFSLTGKADDLQKLADDLVNKSISLRKY